MSSPVLMPTCDEWKALATDRFESYRLKVHGLVESRVTLSLADLRALVENQLRFTMAKWTRSIEVVADIRTIARVEGGHAEDTEHFGEQVSI